MISKKQCTLYYWQVGSAYSQSNKNTIISFRGVIMNNQAIKISKVSDYYFHSQPCLQDETSCFVLTVGKKVFDAVERFGIHNGFRYLSTPYGEVITIFFVPPGFNNKEFVNDFDVTSPTHLTFLNQLTNQSVVPLLLVEPSNQKKSLNHFMEIDLEGRINMSNFIKKCYLNNVTMKSYDFEKASEFLDLKVRKIINQAL